ncbi:hypothetical protein, partial [Salmonella enterica]|uniref:hypothetical protein n=1 Tax=Salmonella enterica TaxID=28901 RepID=UPI003454499D
PTTISATSAAFNGSIAFSPCREASKRLSLMCSSIVDEPRLIDKKIFRGFSLSAVRECSRQTAKSTRRKSNRIHQLLNSSRYARNYGHFNHGRRYPIDFVPKPIFGLWGLFATF